MQNMKSLLMRALGVLLALAIVLPPSAAVAAADSYPSKPVRLIITFSPGGGNDIIGRLVATKLSERLGKPVIVENRAGAGGVLGTDFAAKSAPDGYTLLFISTTYTISPSLYKLPYDHEKSFIPIAKVGSSPYVLAVYPDLPVKSVKELIALAKKKPGELACPASGAGATMHLAVELFKMTAGIDFMVVQFKGGGEVIIDVMGGHSQFLLSSLPTVSPHIKSGKLRALGIGAAKRSSMLPDVPTIAEAGLPYEASIWWGFLAPAGTPKAIVDRLNKEIAVILSLAEMKELLKGQGVDTEHLGPSEFGKFMAAETALWARVIKEGNIKEK